MSQAQKLEPFPATLDASSKFGAHLLAQRIEGVWKRRGYLVQARRVQVSDTAWGVMSDLVAGLPRSRAR